MAKPETTPTGDKQIERGLVNLADMYFEPGTVAELAGAIMGTSEDPQKLCITLLFVGMPDTRKEDKENIPAHAKETICVHYDAQRLNCSVPAAEGTFTDKFSVRTWRSHHFELTLAKSVEVPKEYHMVNVPSPGKAVDDGMINHVLGKHCDHVSRLTPEQICEISKNPAIVEHGCFYFRGNIYRFKA